MKDIKKEIKELILIYIFIIWFTLVCFMWEDVSSIMGG